jgi:hypothetical protein
MSLTAPPVPFGAVWCELWPPPRVVEALPLLAAHGLALNLAWRSEDEPALLAIARAGHALGLDVRPWLLLDRAQGYWPGTTNADTFAAVARALFATFEREGLSPGTLIVDVEPAYERTLALDDALKRGPRALASALARHASPRNDAAFDAAAAIFRALVDDAHRRGWRVALTTLPIVVDDPAPDGPLARWLGLPVHEAAWDQVTLQAYRTVYDGLVPARLRDRGLFSPYLVHAYAQAARARFGARAGLDLGLVGHGVVPAPLYPGPDELRADLRAAAAAGVRPERLAVFNLEGLVERGPIERWLEGAGERASDVAPPRDRATAPMRAALRWASRGLGVVRGRW